MSEAFSQLKRAAARYHLDYLAVFASTAAIFAWVQWCPTFADPDSFYHAKMAELMLRGGLVRDFPWLPLTSLGSAFADHHFLYHAALLPFVAAFGGLLGTKIAAVFFAGLAVMAFYAALRAYAVRLPAVFALAAATCGVFLFRVSLAKATAPALIIAFCSLIAWRKARPVWLFILSWLFVWTHGAWPVIVIIAAAFLAARFFFGETERPPFTARIRSWISRLKSSRPVSSFLHVFPSCRLPHPMSSPPDVFPTRCLPHPMSSPPDVFPPRCLPARSLSSRFRSWFSISEVRCAAATVIGVVAGLVINPFFPQNLFFYWQQIVQIAVVNYYGRVNIGVEWYPLTFVELFQNASAVFIILAVEIGLLCAAIFWGTGARVRQETIRPRPEERAGFIAIVILAVCFMAMAMRQRRHVEYFVPLAIFAEALFLTCLWPFLAAMFRRARDFGSRWTRLGVGLFLAYLIVFFPFLAGRDAWHSRLFNLTGRLWSREERAAEWLRENLPANEIIFISDWADFPPLFYRDDRHRYVIGLDPTFLHLADPEKYRRYDDIVTGRIGAPGALIRWTFGSRVAVVARSNEGLIANLRSDPHARVAYEDDEAVIFSLF